MVSMDAEEFRTLTGDREQEKKQLTSAMEDYLEMICRMAEDGMPVRTGELARRLHVAPSSATKMAAIDAAARTASVKTAFA